MYPPLQTHVAFPGFRAATPLLQRLLSAGKGDAVCMAGRRSSAAGELEGTRAVVAEKRPGEQ
jgi:hypothetical protein